MWVGLYKPDKLHNVFDQIDLFVKYEDFLESSRYTASLPWIRYSASTNVTLLSNCLLSYHIYFSERWLSWKHCIVVFVAFFYVKCPEPLNTICHRMTGTFWKCTMFLNLPIEEVSLVWKAVKQAPLWQISTPWTLQWSRPSCCPYEVLLLPFLVRAISSSFSFSSYKRK